MLKIVLRQSKHTRVCLCGIPCEKEESQIIFGLFIIIIIFYLIA